MIKKLLFYFLCSCSALSTQAQSFQNPILAGYYPDPSICRAGDDYYIVTSSFAHYPGLPLFHSKDLLNWKQLGYAMDRPEQLNLDSAGVSRGLFAPAIRYHNRTFYIVCTEVSKLGNFVITAKNPKGPWSNPVKLPQVNGIDPSLFFDDNGKAYIVFNSIPPNNVSAHDGHRTIRMFEFDVVNLKVLGEEKLLINGGTDMAKKPVWIEAPHILKKDGWYYLICAEGGTGYNHSEVVFRSKSPDGPFVSYEKNPILTQRQLDPKRKHPITTTGHADFVEGKDGKWWGVFLGCRPYEDDHYNTGRETFMAPVIWKEGWPEFDLGGDEVKYSYPINAVIDPNKEPFNGNYHFRDEFDGDKLNSRFQFLRTVRSQWYNLRDKPGALSIQLRPETCAGKGNPSLVGFHQPHLKGYAATSLSFTPTNASEKAGLLIFQNEKTYYFLCQSLKEGKPVVELYKDTQLVTSKLLNNTLEKEIYFKIEAKGDQYAFHYATKKNDWQLLLDHAEAKYLSTKSAGGFVGCLYSMYATSNGNTSANAAHYHWFEVKNDDDVYK
jgi:alpha-N-arabinofuranosidase